MSLFSRFSNNDSAVQKFLNARHPLTEEITKSVISGELNHSLRLTHLLMLSANALEREYAPGVEQANILARMAVVLYDNPRLLNELEAKMEELR